jgi:hypothetical protein
MAEENEPTPPRTLADTAVGDRDVDLKAVFVFLGALVGASAVIMALVWGLSVYFKGELAALDPAPSPLPEANARRPPPEPRLEVNPPESLAELRAREDEVLKSWGWTDKDRRLARIPIARALEIIAKKGLPAPPVPEPPGGGKK